MGVVRIDDELDKQIESLLKKEENRYRFPSKTTFLNVVLHEHLLSIKKERKKR
ncbi:hypothetical protein KY362_03550 [Candidatus Woesearchaeota archaeon]|nr:hypothetical protein [Candidatus Woesearchaeota archaeon]